MNKSIVCCVVGLLGLGGCSIEHWDDECSGGDAFDHPNDSWSHAGSSSSSPGNGAAGGSWSHSSVGGNASAGGGGGNSASMAGETSGAGEGGQGSSRPPLDSPKPCTKERDCPAGFNCSLVTHECLPADEETCAELETELACTHRSDCVPVYGGVNCSCGKDCACHGGEAGCVCESFQFFVCQAAQ